MILIEFLLPGNRQRVLNLLLLHPQDRYHVREIARLINTSAGSLHRELSSLANSEVLLRETSGRQVYYQANTNYLLYNELVAILKKTSGLADILAKALSPLAKKIDAAFIFGSIARDSENIGSDVDLLIIGEITLSDAVTALYDTQAVIGREINPRIYKKAEWQKLIKGNNAFIRDVLIKPKIFIIGTENDIG